MSGQSAASSGHDAPTVAATAPTTVEQAAAILGVSVTTIKRRIRAGTLRAEHAQRPQGMVWLVYLDAAASPAAEERPPAASVAATAAATVPAQAEAMVSLIQTTIGTVLGPLVGELAAQRQANERQADRVAELERENGRLTAELEAAAAEAIAAKVQAGRIADELQQHARLQERRQAVLDGLSSPEQTVWQRWTRRGLIALGVILVVLVVAVLLFVLPPLDAAM